MKLEIFIDELNHKIKDPANYILKYNNTLLDSTCIFKITKSGNIKNISIFDSKDSIHSWLQYCADIYEGDDEEKTIDYIKQKLVIYRKLDS